MAFYKNIILGKKYSDFFLILQRVEFLTILYNISWLLEFNNSEFFSTFCPVIHPLQRLIMAYTHHISKAKLPWKFYKSVADLLGISRYFLISGI